MNEYNYAGAPYRPAYARNGDKFTRGAAATLDASGETALTNAKNAIARVDPNGTALKFAFITDLHRCGEGIGYAGGGIIDDRYSIRLLSRLCDDLDISAVFCGGDIVNARDENVANIDQNMADVVNDFDDYLPYTPVFATVGNHDKKYSAARPLHTNAWLKQLWSPVASEGDGVKFSYIDDTNFCVDFTKHKVRIVFCNQYDAVDSNSSWYANSIHCTGNWTQGLDFADKANWFVGVVYHGADMADYGGTFPELKENLDAYVTNGGKGSLGGFAGHLHTAKEEYISGTLNRIHVDRAYSETSQLETVGEYCFSVFVIDSTTGVFHEVHVGRAAKEYPFAAYPSGQNGLLQNGMVAVNSYDKSFCVYNGNHVRFDRCWGTIVNGENLTDLSKNSTTGNYAADRVTSDTENVLFSAQAGDVIKTELIFSADTTSTKQICVFSPQIPYTTQSGTFKSGMVWGTAGASKTLTNEITLAQDTDFTALGISYRGASGDGVLVMEFELNVYKNGVKMIRQS